MAAISKQTNKHYFKLMILWFSCKKNKVLVFQSESDTAKKKRVLERQKKKETLHAHLKLKHFAPEKSPCNQYYPKSVPNPDILIILLSKNE